MSEPSKSHDEIKNALDLLFAGNQDANQEALGLIADKYVATQILGCEGQATIVVANDQTLNRKVVLKIYHQGITAAEKTRILNEGRALARIESPHVVRCLGVEEVDSVYILVLEFVEGLSLDEYLSKNTLGTKEKIKLFRQLVVGVTAVHDQDLLHLDLKPANVLVDKNGVAKLIDFGLVQTLSVNANVDGSPGTPAFMPPEIADPSLANVGRPTDVFGLGAILYYMLTGQAPFTGESSTSCLRSSRSGEIAPLNENAPQIPSAVEKLCTRCLDQLPTNRFASTRELLDEVDSYLKANRVKWWSVAAITASMTNRVRWWSAAAIAAGIMLVAFMLWQWNDPKPSPVSDGDENVSDINKIGYDLLGDKEKYVTLTRKAWIAVGSGDWDKAVKIQTQATELAKQPHMRATYYGESKSKLDGLREILKMNEEDSQKAHAAFRGLMALTNKPYSPDNFKQLEEVSAKLDAVFKKDNAWLIHKEIFRIGEYETRDGRAKHWRSFVKLGERANKLGALGTLAIAIRFRLIESYREMGWIFEAGKAVEAICNDTRDHPGLPRMVAADAMMTMARSCVGFGPARAKKLLNELTEIYNEELGKPYLEKSGWNYDVASLRLELDEPDLAIERGKKALELFKKELNDSDQFSNNRKIWLMTHAKLASAYARMSKRTRRNENRYKAESHLEICTGNYLRILETDHSTRGELEVALSDVFDNFGQYQEAIDYAERAFKSLSIGNPNSQNSLLALTNWVDLLRRYGDPKESAVKASLLVKNYKAQADVQPVVLCRAMITAAHAYLKAKAVGKGRRLLKEAFDYASAQKLLSGNEGWNKELGRIRTLKSTYLPDESWNP